MEQVGAAERIAYHLIGISIDLVGAITAIDEIRTALPGAFDCPGVTVDLVLATETGKAIVTPDASSQRGEVGRAVAEPRRVGVAKDLVGNAGTLERVVQSREGGCATNNDGHVQILIEMSS